MSLARALLVERPEVELVQRVFPDETHERINRELPMFEATHIARLYVEDPAS